jgi:fatty-acid desaturase
MQSYKKIRKLQTIALIVYGLLTIFGVILTLHRYATMLLSWQRLAFVSQLSQSADDAETGVAWLYDIIDIAILSSLVRVSEEFRVLSLFLSEERLNVASLFLYLLSALSLKNGNGTCCTHNSYFSRRPSVVEVGTELLTTHHDV